MRHEQDGAGVIGRHLARLARYQHHVLILD
jgi:hypothetical protein